MTAEVAILNASGVALAADSAITIGERVYNSVNKLFTLSKHHPVGIMVYNSADVMTMPVETVIKEFRRQLGEESYSTLDGYCDRFLDFLRDERLMFTDEAREDDYMSKVKSVLRPLNEKAKTIVRERGADGDDEKAIARAVQAEVREFVKDVESYEIVDGKSVTDIDAVIAELEPKRDEIIKMAVDKTPLTAPQKRNLLRAVASLFVREYPLLFTGIVIAGFGNDEFLPKLRSFHFYGSSFGITRIKPVETVDIGAKNHLGRAMNASIIGFAQSDMVKTFTQGMAPEVPLQANRSVLQTFRKMKESLGNGIGSEELARFNQVFDSISEDVVKNLTEHLAKYTIEKHYVPTLLTIEGLPKEDMARMAESLVSITSLKRKATGKQETVGGPIDVAIISKGDGFVFTQRKHYFAPELNPAFVHNYFRTP